MKNSNQIFIFISVLVICTLSLVGCLTDQQISLKELAGIQKTRYYQTDIIPVAKSSIYGKWKVTATSGGFTGMGYKKDFDYLLLKQNGIFGIVRNDSLIAYGKLNLLVDNGLTLNNAVYSKFDFEVNADVELNHDADKYITLVTNDSLSLIAPCCDRYNTHFIRQSTEWYNSTNPGTLKGNISIGPLCPVETNPPLPGCKPTAETFRAYQTSVWNSNKTIKICDIIPNLDGTFQLDLSEGNYYIDYSDAKSKGIGSNNLPLQFSITHLKTTQVNVSIDTGIR